MAEQRVTYSTKTFFSASSCMPVALCVNDAWAGTTVSGVNIIFGTLQNTGRALGYRGQLMYAEWENPRDVDLYQYEIVYDDAQITGATPLLTCADIDDMQKACFWQKFVDFASV